MAKLLGVPLGSRRCQVEDRRSQKTVPWQRLAGSGPIGDAADDLVEEGEASSRRRLSESAGGGEAEQKRKRCERLGLREPCMRRSRACVGRWLIGDVVRLALH